MRVSQKKYITRISFLCWPKKTKQGVLVMIRSSSPRRSPLFRDKRATRKKRAQICEPTLRSPGWSRQARGCYTHRDSTLPAGCAAPPVSRYRRIETHKWNGRGNMSKVTPVEYIQAKNRNMAGRAAMDYSSLGVRISAAFSQVVHQAASVGMPSGASCHPRTAVSECRLG
jgi:hypothetical protein